MGSKLKKWRTGIDCVDIYPRPPRLTQRWLQLRGASTKRKINSSRRSISSPSHSWQPQKPLLCAPLSNRWTHRHIGSSSRTTTIRWSRTPRSIPRGQCLWLLPVLTPPQTHKDVYPIYNAEPSSGHAKRNDYKDSDQGIVHGSTGLPFSMVSDDGQPTTTTRASTSATINRDRTELLNNHHRLGHISIKRARSLNIDGIPQPHSKMPKVKCPVCIASKATRHKRPSASTADTRSASGPWQDIYSDLSGKMRISSICRYRYVAVFVCAWSGAKHCEFIAHKNHFIDAYRRFLANTGIKPQYIRTLRIDRGGEYINHPMQALMNEHLSNHVVCAKDEHYSVGAAKTAVNNLRHSARAMMLHGNVPKRFWHLS